MITNEKRKELAKEIHANAIEKGFWSDNLSSKHYLMLVISELSEAVEADRMDRRAKREEYEAHSKNCVPASAFNIAGFESFIKDTVEDELADAYIRILDLAEGKDMDTALPNTPLAFDHAVEQVTCQTLTENMAVTVAGLIEGFEGNDMSEVLAYLEIIAEVYEIDLLWHIEAKMKYNAMRPMLHGKKY